MDISAPMRAALPKSRVQVLQSHGPRRGTAIAFRTMEACGRIAAPQGGCHVREEVASKPSSQEPLNLLRQMTSELDRMFDEPWTLFRWPAADVAPPDAPIWAPKVDVVTKDNKLVTRVDLPGMKKEDVLVEVEDGLSDALGRAQEGNQGRKRQRLSRRARIRQFLPHRTAAERRQGGRRQGDVQQRRARGHRAAAGRCGRARTAARSRSRTALCPSRPRKEAILRSPN